MKVAIVLTLLALLVACAYTKEHCFGKAFHTKEAVIDPKKSFDDISEIFYDATTNRQRINIAVEEPVRKNFEIYYRYDQGKMYELDKDTNKCLTLPITGNIEPFCLAKNATKVDDIVLGGVLKAEVWEENIRGFKVRLVLAPGIPYDVPVNIISSGGANGVVFQEFWDFKAFDQSLPDQSVFNVPSQCN